MSVATDLRFWHNILRAAEAEPVAETSIRGVSGITHGCIAIGVDERRRRLLIVSGEHDARAAAMSQVDIQSALDNFQVLVARPVAFDLPAVAKTLVAISGKTAFTSDDLVKANAAHDGLKEGLLEHFSTILAPLDFLSRIPLNTMAQWMQIVQQLALVQFSMPESQAQPQSKCLCIDLGCLAALEPLERDNHFGVCPVPLYELNDGEIEVLADTTNLDAIRETLRRHGLLQYFFPAADQLAIGLIDRGITSPREILKQVLSAPEIGHPYGDMELVGDDVRVRDVIEALQQRALVVEGEIGWELGPEAKTMRTTLRFKPREGFLTKLINRVSISIDLKNLIGLK